MISYRNLMNMHMDKNDQNLPKKRLRLPLVLSPLHYLISPKYPRVQKRSAVITSYATVDRKSTKYIVRDVGGGRRSREECFEVWT